MYPSDIWCGIRCIGADQFCIFSKACLHRKQYLRVFKRKQNSSIRRYRKHNGGVALDDGYGYIPYADVLNLSKLYLQTGFHCHYCGAKMSIGIISAPDCCSLDHRTSLSKGGTNHLSNLVLCCFKCNCDKEYEEVIRCDTEGECRRTNYVSIAAAISNGSSKYNEGINMVATYRKEPFEGIVREEESCENDELQQRQQEDMVQSGEECLTSR